MARLNRLFYSNPCCFFCTAPVMNPSPSSSSDMSSVSAAAPDRRLSVAELCVFVTVLVCGVIFAVISVQDRLAQTRTDQLHSAAQAVASWVSAAHQARRSGVNLEPDRCSITQHQPLSYCFSDMVSPASPLPGWKTPPSLTQALPPLPLLPPLGLSVRVSPAARCLNRFIYLLHMAPAAMRRKAGPG